MGSFFPQLCDFLTSFPGVLFNRTVLDDEYPTNIHLMFYSRLMTTNEGVTGILTDETADKDGDVTWGCIENP